MFILISLVTLGSLFGWIALAQVMAFPSLLYYLGIIAIFVLEVIATISIILNNIKKDKTLMRTQITCCKGCTSEKGRQDQKE